MDFGEVCSPRTRVNKPMLEMHQASLCGKLLGVSSGGCMRREGGHPVFRQAWLMTVVGLFLMGCAFLLVVGCSGETGSQPTGSQKSEESQRAVTGAERTTGSREDESTHEVAQHCGPQASEESETTDQAA